MQNLKLKFFLMVWRLQMTLAKKTKQKSKPKLHIVGESTAKMNAVKPTYLDGKANLTNLPYTTRTGLRIGAYYTPPKKVVMSRDEEYWQGILLGIKPKSHVPTIVYSLLTLFLTIKLFMANK